MAAGAQLHGLLHEMLADLGRLQAILRRETEALTSSEDETIVQVAAEKQGMLVRLADFTPRLDSILARRGFSLDADGLAACVRQMEGESAEVQPLYDELLALLRSCRVHNQTNGAVLERRRSALNRAMRVLFDQQGTPACYGTGGLADGFGQRRSIGEA